MSFTDTLRAMPEVQGVITADPRGRVIESTEITPGVSEDTAARTAVAMSAFSAAGIAAGLTRLELLLIKGPSRSTATAARTEAFLNVVLDPSKATRGVEAALHDWVREAAVAALAPAPRTSKPTPSPSAPAPNVVTRIPNGATAARSIPPPMPENGVADAAGDRWAALRRAIVRGHLNEAVALQRALGAPSPEPARAGSEPVGEDERQRGLGVLLEGVGSVMAGDGLGGERLLRELAAPSQPNVSLRWLALYWSARGALKSGSLPTARAHVKEALALGRQLDVEATAVSEWIAGEVLSHDRDPARALAWLEEARGQFERLGARWGVARVRLSEARTLASLAREGDADDAARSAAAIDAGWDEPHVFLARRALLRDDLPAAEGILRPLSTPAAERLRAVIEAIRAGSVSRADANEYLREHDAPPSARAIQALGRIANASPRFIPAREALAWMLLKIGKYADAGSIFRGLLTQPLTPGDRASVMLGLGCIGNAQRSQGGAGALRAVVTPPVRAPAAPSAPEPPPVPQLSGSSLLARRSQGPGAPLDAVFSGQLSVFAFPDLLEFLRSAKRTGLLVCSSARGVAALRLRDGRITGADSPGTPDVGELLLRARKISALALRALPDEPDQAIADVLVREGLADTAAVEEALERQIGLAVRELVEWNDGEFAFNREADGDDPRARIAVALDPQAVLLNVFKDMDEKSRPDADATEVRVPE